MGWGAGVAKLARRGKQNFDCGLIQVHPNNRRPGVTFQSRLTSAALNRQSTFSGQWCIWPFGYGSESHARQNVSISSSRPSDTRM